MQTIISIQQVYINAVLKANPKYRALARGKAAARLKRQASDMGFDFAHVQNICNDARDMADLELIARADQSRSR